MTLDLDAVAAALFDEFSALPARVVAEESPVSWHRPGLLSFWVDEVGRADLEAVLGVPMDGHLLGWIAAHAKGERRDDVRDTLWGAVALRLLGYHFSWPRFRLAFLFSPEAWFGSPALRAWIPQHVHVVGLPMAAASAEAVRELLQPPVPALFRPSDTPTPAQARETEIRDAVHAERKVRGGARQQLLAEICARRSLKGR